MDNKENVEKEKQLQKSKKSLKFFIISIIILVIAAGIVGGTFLVKNLIENGAESKDDSVGSKWGDVYYAYLNDIVSEDNDLELESKYGLTRNITDAFVQFCDTNDDEKPAMVMSYKDNSIDKVNIYQISNEDKIVYTKYNKAATLVQLYNIENKSYNWFIRVLDDDGTIEYTPLEDTSEKLKNEKDNNYVEKIEVDSIIKVPV